MLKSFCTAKETVNKMKRQLTEWEKIFVNFISKKGIYSKYILKFIQLNSKKTIWLKMGRISEQTYS